MVQKFKIKKGDQVVVNTGRDKGRRGEVIEVQRTENRVLVQGCNIVKRHTRPTQTNPGGIINKEAPLHISNVSLIDPDGQYNLVLNLQGDLPEMDETIPSILLRTATASGADLTTLVTPASQEEATRKQVVKAVVSWNEAGDVGRALYFSRSAVPHGDAPKWHHVGVYGWRRQALERFVTLTPSPLEQSERLEQLRALEAGMHIAVAAVDEAPAGVDTPEDLEATRARLFAATGG